MKKLTLDIDALDVESFQTADPQRPRGTVLGADGHDQAHHVHRWIAAGNSCAVFA